MPVIQVTVAAAGTPVPFSSVQLMTRNFQVIARRNKDGLNPVANTGTVAIGRSPTAGQLPISMPSLQERTYFASADCAFDLSQWFVDCQNGNGGTPGNGDGVIIDYQ
jgi:hypothetical protein